MRAALPLGSPPPRKAPIQRSSAPPLPLPVVPPSPQMALKYRVWGMQYGRQANEILTSDQGIVDLFHRDGVDGRLLILGEAGLGKTHTLLTLANHLWQLASRSDAPVPVLLDLAGWQGEPLRQWVIDNLWQKYRISQTIAATWVDTAALTLMLDGFDTLAPNQQRACAAAVETLLRGNVSQTAVLCCRRKTLEQLGLTFTYFNSGVNIIPMEAQQVKDFALALERPDLWQTIKADKVLQQLARFPLYLAMVSALPLGRSIANRVELLEAYGRQGLTGTAKLPKMQPFLGWLARHLGNRQRMFYLDELSKDWLPPGQILLYRLLLGLGLALLAFAISGSGLLGLAIGLVCSQVDLDSFPRFRLSWAVRSWRALLTMIQFALIPALVLALVLGGGAALLLGRFMGIAAFAWGASAGVTIGWVLGLLALGWGGVQAAIQFRTIINQDIWMGLRNGVLLVALLGLLILLMVILPASLTGQPPLTLLHLQRFRALLAILVCAAVWLSFGLQYLILRGLLSLGPLHLPWNLSRYLIAATQQGILRQVGGGFSFAHEELRQWLITTQPG